MIARFTAYALACTILSPVATAGKLAPATRTAVHLDGSTEVVYYSSSKMATGWSRPWLLAPASRRSESSRRLGQTQRIVISVPRAVDQPPVEFRDPAEWRSAGS